MPRTIVDKLVRPFFTRRFLAFAAVGASGVVVNLGALSLLRHLGVQINLASAIAIEISILSNFAIHHLWTFGDKRHPGTGLLARGLRFHVVSLAGASIQFLVFVAMNMVWLTTRIAHESPVHYHPAVDDWVVRWLWRPLTDPPEVGSWAYLSQLVGIGCGMISNYLLNFYWTWSGRTLESRAQEGEDDGQGA